MTKKQALLDLILLENKKFASLNYTHKIVPNSIPILWFGNFEKYITSSQKIITVSLNPSDVEFKSENKKEYCTLTRFPSYCGTSESMYTSYNEYFQKKPYNSWFLSSFKSVLESFEASHYNHSSNIALHTDIGSPYATNPTWSGLNEQDKEKLEPMGSDSWHKLIEILEPDVILFSASLHFENKINFPQIGNWKEFNVKADRPLLSGKFKISKEKITSVLFQVQGRKPFLKTSKEEKTKFINYI